MRLGSREPLCGRDSWDGSNCGWTKPWSKVELNNQPWGLIPVTETKPLWFEPDVCQPRPVLALTAIWKAGEVQLFQSCEFITCRFIGTPFVLDSASSPSVSPPITKAQRNSKPVRIDSLIRLVPFGDRNDATRRTIASHEIGSLFNRRVWWCVREDAISNSHRLIASAAASVSLWIVMPNPCSSSTSAG